MLCASLRLHTLHAREGAAVTYQHIVGSRSERCDHLPVNSHTHNIRYLSAVEKINLVC